MKILFKKILYTLVLSVGLISVSSCADYLDVSDEIADNLSLEDVFENKGYVQKWHANIFNSICAYEFMGGAGEENGFSGVWNLLSGEVTANGGSAYTTMINGFTADTAPFHRWSSIYAYIRQSMILLEHIKPVGDPNSLSDTYLSSVQVERMKMEAKFFIAYNYLSLFELYGPVPIIKEIADPNDPNFTDYPRASVDEMVAYIDGLFGEVINSDAIPETTFASGGASENRDHSDHNNAKYALSEAVRPTKAAALALRARLWVYAASPLFNGGYTEAVQTVNYDGTPIFPASNPEKWKTAKQHLETFLNFAEDMGYGLFEVEEEGIVNADKSVYELFQYYNDEIIWATNQNGYYAVSSAMEKRSNPRGVYNGWANLGVFQETVDAFFMSNGLEINDSGSGYSEEGFADLPNRINEDKRVDKNVYNMYHGREPRFYAAITYEGRSWHVQPPGNANYVTSFAKGGDTDLSRLENPKTGYMLYKFKNRQVYGTTRPASGGKLELFKQWARPNILLRLADFYLYYAEACNEVDPGDPNVIEYLDRVRRRAGIPGYKELKEQGKKDIIGNQENQRWAIQRERQVEFLCEGQRYFDVRRWMTANDANNPYDQQITRSGMDMTQPNQGVGVGSFFNRVVLERRAWTRAMLLYPIPYTEIQRSPGKILIQNPLW